MCSRLCVFAAVRCWFLSSWVFVFFFCLRASHTPNKLTVWWRIMVLFIMKTVPLRQPFVDTISYALQILCRLRLANRLCLIDFRLFAKHQQSIAKRWKLRWRRSKQRELQPVTIRAHSFFVARRTKAFWLVRGFGLLFSVCWACLLLGVFIDINCWIFFLLFFVVLFFFFQLEQQVLLKSLSRVKSTLLLQQQQKLTNCFRW